jgi:uncharacterized membrane protein YedE/YeeE
VTAIPVSVADDRLSVTASRAKAAQRPYANPYLAGIGLGLVLLAAFVLVGRGLGASGGFASAAATASSLVAPEATRGNDYFARYLGSDGKPTVDWLVIELAGVIIGGLISASLAGRLHRSIERGPRITDRTRLLFAFTGGAIMGVGAMLARGCTSGQALTGGALLSVGSWLFIGAAFAAAYAVAPFLKRAWL